MKTKIKKEMVKKLFDYLKAEGLTEKEISSILSNAYRENREYLLKHKNE